MGGIYLGELANNTIKLEKCVEEQRHPGISAVDC